MKSKLKYLAAVGLLIVLAAAAILLKNKLPLADPDAGQPLLVEAKQTEQQWERLEFFPVSDTNRFYHYLKGLPIQGAELLTEEQLEKVYTTFLSMVRAYTEGTYEAYMNFRFPPGVKFIKNQQDADLRYRSWDPQDKYWKQLHPDSDITEPTDEELYHWSVYTRSEGKYYKDVWQGVCIDPKEIYEKLGQVNREEKRAKAGIYIYEGLEALENLLESSSYWKVTGSTFTAAGGIARVLIPSYLSSTFPKVGTTEIDPEWKSMACYFFVKSPGQPIAPFYFYFFWEKEGAQWVPVDRIVGSLLPEGPLMLSFL